MTTELALSIAGFLISVLGGVVITLVRYNFKTTIDGLQKQIGDIETSGGDGDDEIKDGMKSLGEKLEAMTERIHQEEVASVRVQGELKLLTIKDEGLARDLATIGEKMVRRDEFETRMAGIDRQLQRILDQVSPRRYSPQHMPVTPDPRRDPDR